MRTCHFSAHSCPSPASSLLGTKAGNQGELPRGSLHGAQHPWAQQALDGILGCCPWGRRALGRTSPSQPGPSSMCRERDRTSSEGFLWGSDEVNARGRSVPPPPQQGGLVCTSVGARRDESPPRCTWRPGQDPSPGPAPARRGSGAEESVSQARCLCPSPGCPAPHGLRLRAPGGCGRVSKRPRCQAGPQSPENHGAPDPVPSLSPRPAERHPPSP